MNLIITKRKGILLWFFNLEDKLKKSKSKIEAIEKRDRIDVEEIKDLLDDLIYELEHNICLGDLSDIEDFNDELRELIYELEYISHKPEIDKMISEFEYVVGKLDCLVDEFDDDDLEDVFGELDLDPPVQVTLSGDCFSTKNLVAAAGIGSLALSGHCAYKNDWKGSALSFLGTMFSFATYLYLDNRERKA